MMSTNSWEKNWKLQILNDAKREGLAKISSGVNVD